MSPRTSGRFLVRDICASNFGSYIMFRVFAQAQLSAVPVIRLRSVNGESSMAEAIGVTATGNREYAVVVVRTMRNESRGLDKER